MGADRGDDHEPGDAELAGRFHRLDGRAVVDRPLTVRPAPWPGAGGEHDRVGRADVRAQVVAALQITQHRFGVRRLKFAGLLGLPDHATAAVPIAREQPQQTQAHPAMAADHQHLHGRQCTEAAAAHQRDRRRRCSVGSRLDRRAVQRERGSTRRLRRSSARRTRPGCGQPRPAGWVQPVGGRDGASRTPVTAVWGTQ